MANTRKSIFGVDLDVITYGESLRQMVDLATRRVPSYACFVNVHMTIEAQDDPEFRAQINRASLSLTDGVPVAKTLELFYRIKQDRIAGMDVMPDLIRLAQEQELSVYFFGSTEETLRLIGDRLSSEFPRVRFVGSLSPEFGGDLDRDDYIRAIRRSGANIVFVSLGCPKQEKWMARNSFKVDALMLGVGGVFQVFAGQVSRAPRVIQKLGLEWLYRLLQEPRRLFKRYFVTNTRFIWLVMKGIIGSKRNK